MFCFVLICLWFFFLSFFFILFYFFKFNRLGWAFRQANQQTNAHMNSTSTSEYCNMWSKSERAYPTPVGDRRSFQSIKYQFGPDLRVFPSVSLICGDDTYCSFLVGFNQDLSKHKWKVAEVMTREDWGGDGNALTAIVRSWFVCFFSDCRAVSAPQASGMPSVYIYTVIIQSCREESLSMLVQHGKPPSLSGFSS